MKLWKSFIASLTNVVVFFFFSIRNATFEGQGKDAQCFFFVFFYLTTPHIPSGWMSCLSLDNLVFFSVFLSLKFSGKKDARRNEGSCLTIKIRHSIVDCVCALYTRLGSFAGLCEGYLLFVYFLYKENKNRRWLCAIWWAARKCTGITHRFMYIYEFFLCVFITDSTRLVQIVFS